MKILTKEVKECTNMDDTKTMVLILTYSYKGETGKLLLKDYHEQHYNKYLRQLKKAAKEQYNLTKEQGQLAQT